VEVCGRTIPPHLARNRTLVISSARLIAITATISCQLRVLRWGHRRLRFGIAHRRKTITAVLLDLQRLDQACRDLILTRARIVLLRRATILRGARATGARRDLRSACAKGASARPDEALVGCRSVGRTANIIVWPGCACATAQTSHVCSASRALERHILLFSRPVTHSLMRIGARA